MVATHEIRAGAKVSGSRGERLGVVDTITTDATSGLPSAFIVKSGFWPMTKRKILSVDVIRQVNNDPDTVILRISKGEFRDAPETHH